MKKQLLIIGKSNGADDVAVITVMEGFKKIRDLCEKRVVDYRYCL